MNTLKLLCLIVGLSTCYFGLLANPDSDSAFSSDEMCIDNPNISCPAFVWLKPSESAHPNRTGFPTFSAGGPSCDTPIITYSDEIFIINACHKVYTRTWTATDPNNPNLSSSCQQEIKQLDEEAPIFDVTPSDIMIYTDAIDPQTMSCSQRVTWTYPIVYDNHILQSVTQTVSRNGVVLDLKSGDIFPEGVTTVEYVALDFCGNFSTYSFTISIMCADCHVDCPEDIVIDLNAGTDPTTTGLPSAFSSNMNCGSITNSYFEDLVLDSTCASRVDIQRTWFATYENMPQATYSCQQLITLQDTNALVIYNCPSDLNVVDNFTKAHWPTPIAIASDNTTTINLSSNYAPGRTFPVGITTVIYTATDACGNKASCSFKVSVLADATYPDCPDDIVIECNENGVGVVNYQPPSYIGTCSSCAHGGYKPGFMYVGSFNGSQYYCSSGLNTYEEAQQLMTPYGGHLASINSKEENDYLAKRIATSTAMIGLTDVNKEGTFTWDDGSPVTYTNWYQRQPNDYNNQDYVEIMKNTGLWNDVDNNSKLEFVMEIPCTNVIHVGGPLPGAHLQPGNYTVTYNIVDGCGLNEYCTFDITVKEGLSMICQDNIFVEVPSSTNEVSVSWEVPHTFSCCTACDDPTDCITVTQIAGPAPGSLFYRQSKTEIIYEAIDLCGNRTQCSFEVLVDIDVTNGLVTDNKAGSTMSLAASTETKTETDNSQSKATQDSATIEIFFDAHKQEQELKLYPNPVHEHLYIDIENFEAIVGLQLIGPQGNILVNRGRIVSNRQIIDMSHLAQGLYYLQLTHTDGQRSTEAIVKQ